MSSFFWVEYTNLSHDFGYHRHEVDELILIRRGEVVVYTENNCFNIKAPCAVFFKNGAFHNQVNMSREYERYCFQFDRNFTYNVYIDYSLFFKNAEKDSFYISLDPAVADRLFRAAENIRLIYQKQYPNDIRLKLQFAYILSELSGTARCTGNDSQCDYYMYKILSHIEDNLENRLTLENISKQYKVSKTKLVRDFRKYLSVSFSEYVTMQRMNRARRMLFNGESLDTIAEACGYNDTSYFIKVFKKNIGRTPAQYRRRFREM